MPRFPRSLKVLAAGLSALALTVPMGNPSSAAPMAQPAVVGGTDVSISSIPWQVLFIIDNESVCGGALVSPTKIVSAAHCFDGFPPSKVAAWAGITQMSDRSASSQLAIGSITMHPDYNAATFANDIAVVNLSAPVPARLGAITIALPSGEDAATWPAAGVNATVSGWGEKTSGVPVASNNLQIAVIEIMAAPSAAECGSYGGAYIPALQICAGVPEGGVDGCQGDSGGPLTTYVNGEPILAGVSSTGLECGLAGYPGLYVRMTTYLPWLASQGIDITAGGSTAIVATPGSARDGVPANFLVGQTYSRAVFAKYAGLKATTSQLKVTGGAACTQVKQTVRIDKAGKCRLTVTQGKKSVPVIVTVYSS